MSSGKSSSSSSSATENISEDNRVVADGSGTIALGKEAIYNYSPDLTTINELSPNMLTALKEFVSLVRDAGEVVVNTTEQTNKQTQDTISKFTSAIQNDKLGTSTTEQSIVKYIPLAIGALVLFFILSGIRRGK